jgi:chemotaxis protein CheX
MTTNSKEFTLFSKPIIESLKKTFDIMMKTGITPNSPQLNVSTKSHGDITSIISIDGEVTQNGAINKFRGHISVSFIEEVFIKVASKMLMTEYTEYCDDIADAGGEIVNIVIGNAKQELKDSGYNIDMATPLTLVKGEQHNINYDKETVIIETKIDSELGDFVFEICYQKVA